MHKKQAFGFDPDALSKRVMELGVEMPNFALYTSNQYKTSISRYELLFSWGAGELYGAEKLKSLSQDSNEWLFGYLGYDLRLSFEDVAHENLTIGNWPESCFFKADIVGTLDSKGVLELQGPNQEILEHLEARLRVVAKASNGSAKLDFQPVESKLDYVRNVGQLKRHIQLGDLYEVNYCTAFKAEIGEIDRCALWQKTVERTRAPFTAFLKLGDLEVFSNSPERYLFREGQRLYSQPIKGTNRRLKNGNSSQKQALLDSEKERAENVMIVDLVRNDLSRVAQKGSVCVDELFGVYTFKNVNQMISTVSCWLREDVSFWDILKATFPMGSMTGAPKVSAMNLADQYEVTGRGVYSGAIGYIMPSGDFDFNVVIRSIVLDHQSKQASCHVGSAITILSDPEQEFLECMLKAESLLMACR